MRSVGATLVKLIATATSGLVSFTTNVIRPVKVTCEFSPVQEGTGDPSPDNVRPISGWTGVSIYDYGVNLFNKEDLESNINHYISDGGNFRTPGSGNWRVSNYIPIIGGMVYTIGNMQRASSTAPSMCWYTADKTYITNTKYLTATTEKVVTAPDNAAFVRLSVDYTMIDLCQLEFGQQATQYRSFAGTTLPITFTDPSTGDPLTVYGGELTINEDGSADLVSEWAIKEYDGSSDESWLYELAKGYPNFYVPRPSDMIAGITIDTIDGMRSNMLNLFRVGRIVVDGRITITEGYVNFTIGNLLGINNLSDYLSWLENNNLQWMYKLATPQTYHFDNIGQLKTLIGENVIWSDTNGINTAEYWNKQ